MPDAALRSAAWLDDEIEDVVGKPVVSANQATFWEAMRLAEGVWPQGGLGILFRL